MRRNFGFLVNLNKTISIAGINEQLDVKPILPVTAIQVGHPD